MILETSWLTDFVMAEQFRSHAMFSKPIKKLGRKKLIHPTTKGSSEVDETAQISWGALQQLRLWPRLIRYHDRMVTKANKHVVAFSPLELLQDFLWSPCVLNFCPFSSSCSQQLQRRNVVTVFLMHVLLKKQAVFRRVFCGFAFSSSISINPSNVQHPGVVGGDSIVNSKLTLPSTHQQQQHPICPLAQCLA